MGLEVRGAQPDGMEPLEAASDQAGAGGGDPHSGGDTDCEDLS